MHDPNGNSHTMRSQVERAYRAGRGCALAAPGGLRPGGWALAIAALLALAMPGRSQAVRFTDITTSAGVRGASPWGGHGVAMGDLDGDGDLDMYVTNSLGPDSLRNLLYINNGNATFQEVGVARGADDRSHVGAHGVTLADVDRDGDLDIVIGNAGDSSPERNTLLLNDGTAFFIDVTVARGLASVMKITRGVVAVDVEGDGDLDIYAVNDDAKSDLYLNNGAGSFVRTVRGAEDELLGKQGVTAVDVNGDGSTDLYVNKWGNSSNRLFLNNGGGQFRERADSLGIAEASSGTSGTAFGDIDRDGDWDAAILNKATGNPPLHLYRRGANGLYQNETGLQEILGDGYTPAFGDVDNDGDIDLFVARATAPWVLYENDGTGHFSAVPGAGVEVTGSSTRSAAFGDIDNDGDLDLMVVQRQGRNYLFRNETNNGSSLEVRLIGPEGEAGALGARLWLYEGGHLGEPAFLRGIREVRGASGYLAQDSPWQHFGVNPAHTYDLRVAFPTGEIVEQRGVAAGGILTLDARNLPPLPFALVAPADEETLATSLPLLDWEDAVDPDPGDVLTYTLHLATSPAFPPDSTRIVEGLTASGYPVPSRDPLTDETRYFWKVAARDGGGLEAWSRQTWSFSVGIPDPPLPFSLLQPTDGDTVETAEPLLVWHRAVDPDPGDTLLIYSVLVDEDPAFGSPAVSTDLPETTYRAPALERGTRYFWKVLVTDRDHLVRQSQDVFRFTVAGPVGVEGHARGTALPKALGLDPNTPNPFNPSTDIPFALPAQEREQAIPVSLQIFTVRGESIRGLLRASLPAGYYRVHWDGTDDRGQASPSGLYFVRLSVGGRSLTRKLTLLR